MSSLSLHTIGPKKGSRASKKRVGRGLGSTGSYSGRGVKGQRSRSGGKSGLKLKGLRSLMLSTPKQRGFVSNQEKAQEVNVGDISGVFVEGAVVSPDSLKKRGLVLSAQKRVKLLGRGVVSKKLTIKHCEVTQSAAQKIREAGGTIV